MNKIPTADTMLDDRYLHYYYYPNGNTTKPMIHDRDCPFCDIQSKVEEKMIEFAKMHVKAALGAASSKARMNLTYPEPYEDSNEQGLTYASADEISRGGEYGSVEIDDESILSAYPENNII